MDVVKVWKGVGPGIRQALKLTSGMAALPPPREEDYLVPRTLTVGNADTAAREVFEYLAAGERTEQERRRALERLAKVTPELLAEIRVCRLVLRDLRGAIERG